MIQFLKTTIIGGVLFLVPIIILIEIVGAALKITNKLASPMATYIPIESIGDIAILNLLAILVLLLICFLAGLAASSALALRLVESVESKILSKVPGYDLYKWKLTDSPDDEKMKPVLVRFDEFWQIAFEIEPIEGGKVAVYLPGAPDPWLGSVCFIPEANIKRLDLKLASALEVLRALGKGSNERLRLYLQES